jgi:cytoskeleton protein RodZ
VPTTPSANITTAPPANVATATPATSLSPATPMNQVPAAPSEASAAAAESSLVLTFTGTSWVQVKDASGAVIMSQTSTTGATVPVSGRPPFALVIGNADHVRTQFRGKPVDLAPHTVHNVARLVLK